MTEPFHREIKSKKPNGHKGSGRMEATATTTHGGGRTCSDVRVGWGGGADRSDAFKTNGGRFSPQHILNQEGVEKSGWITPPETFGWIKSLNNHHMESFHPVLLYSKGLI